MGSKFPQHFEMIRFETPGNKSSKTGTTLGTKNEELWH